MGRVGDRDPPGGATENGYGSSARRGRRPFGTSVKRLAAVIVLTYLGVCVLIGFLQSRLIYFPTRDYAITPADVGLDYEELTLETADGVSIAAWYIPHPNPKGSAIFCHGNAGNMSDRLHSVALLRGMGLNVLIFDYRGFGRSAGSPSEQGTYADADAAWTHLVETRGKSPDRIILLGRSLGGAVAIELASRHTPAALVVESTFTNLLDIGRMHFPFLPVRWLLTYRYESIDRVPRITCPKLFLHGREDTLIPLENGRKLFDAAAKPKQFVETPGGHNEAGFTYSPEYTGRVADFVDEVLLLP